MRKSKIILAPVLMVTSIGLAGCGVNEKETADSNRLEATRPIGYYSNEKHDSNSGDNDGPITEMLDHTYGNESNTNKINVQNVNYPTNKVAEKNNQIIDLDMANKAVNLAESNKDVSNAQSIVYGNKIILALEVASKDNMDKTKADVENTLARTFNNKDISIITDRGIFTDIEEINRSIKNGQPPRTISNSIESIMNRIDSL